MMEGLESSYNRKEKHEKSMCKHCKSTAHSTLEHRKHYKNFQEENKEKRMEKHMKMWEPEEKETKEEPAKKHMKGLPKTYDGKSTKLGHGGRAAKLHDELPGKMPESEKGAIIGKIAREKGAAPGGPNYHGKHKKMYPEIIKSIRNISPDLSKPLPRIGTSFDVSNGSSAPGREGSAMSNFGRASMGPKGPVGGNAESTTPTAKLKHEKHKKEEGIGGGFNGDNLKKKHRKEEE